MQCRGQEAYIKVLCEYGSVDKICHHLNSSANEGVSGTRTDLDSRRNYFGANVIPSKGTKSFFRQLLVALSDVILIILIVAALISIGMNVSLIIFYLLHSKHCDNKILTLIHVPICTA